MTADAATDPNLIHLQRVVKLTQVCQQAKRVVPRGKRFEADAPTQYDCFHDYLNELITEIVGH